VDSSEEITKSRAFTKKDPFQEGTGVVQEQNEAITRIVQRLNGGAPYSRGIKADMIYEPAGL
jgi:hypothetical protein